METIKPNIIALLSILIFIFSLSGCDEIIDEVISECDEKVNQIDPAQPRSFQEVCEVHFKNGGDTEGIPVKMEIKKQYCNGNDSGYKTFSGNLNDHGVWDSFYVATYDFKNKKDRVLVKWTLSYGGLDHVYDYVYRWEDVEGWVNTKYYVTIIYLPGSNSDGPQ